MIIFFQKPHIVLSYSEQDFSNNQILWESVFQSYVIKIIVKTIMIV